MQSVLCHAWISLSLRSFSILAVGGLWALGLLADSLALCLAIMTASSLAYLYSIAVRQRHLGLKLGFKQTLAEMFALVGLLLGWLVGTEALITTLVATYGLIAVINSVDWFRQSADSALNSPLIVDSPQAETTAMVCVCHVVNAAMIGIIFPLSSTRLAEQIQELAPILGSLFMIAGLFCIYVCLLMFDHRALISNRHDRFT